MPAWRTSRPSDWSSRSGTRSQAGDPSSASASACSSSSRRARSSDPSRVSEFSPGGSCAFRPSPGARSPTWAGTGSTSRAGSPRSATCRRGPTPTSCTPTIPCRATRRSSSRPPSTASSSPPAWRAATSSPVSSTPRRVSRSGSGCSTTSSGRSPGAADGSTRTAMTVYPAIDLRGGRCVRLLQGAFERETVYGDDPVAVARGFEAAGARWLHVVDLDGARAGHPVQHELVARICAAVHIPVQVGGGLRDRAAIEAAFATGASRVVVGTTAAHDPDRCGELCAAHPGRVVVGLDVRAGQVRVAGWTEAATPDPLTLARRVATLGPVEIASRYDAEGADELTFLDITASHERRPIILDVVARTAERIFMPLTVGGGVRTVDDVRALLRAGADKVSINTAAVERPELVREA